MQLRFPPPNVMISPQTPGKLFNIPGEALRNRSGLKVSASEPQNGLEVFRYKMARVSLRLASIHKTQRRQARLRSMKRNVYGLTDENLGTLVKHHRLHHLPIVPFDWLREG